MSRGGGQFSIRGWEDVDDIYVLGTTPSRSIKHGDIAISSNHIENLSV